MLAAADRGAAAGTPSGTIPRRSGQPRSDLEKKLMEARGPHAPLAR